MQSLQIFVTFPPNVSGHGPGPGQLHDHQNVSQGYRNIRVVKFYTTACSASSRPTSHSKHPSVNVMKLGQFSTMT